MSTLWNTTGAESGILRRYDTKDRLEDLLVFGYACKLFRDDHKALDIDQGKHLIPWMGDNSLKIDRYDGRGALSDLKPFEASKEGYDAMRWLGLSESDRKIEQLCDEERYFSLHTNEEEDELYKEEEIKRLQSNQVQYTYNEKPLDVDLKSDKQPKTDDSVSEEDDEPFVPPPGLDIPVNMTLPMTIKQNARIEKTALFIGQQGPQMEILLKTKQSGNPQFSFLTQNDPLYRYYRHVLMAIKTGRFHVQSEQPKIEQTENQEEDHYLHPSLASMPVQSIQSAPIIPQINYKPSADCAYSQLINKIKGNQSATSIQSTTTGATSTKSIDQNALNSQPTPDQHQTAINNLNSVFNHPAYIQFYQQYGYWPQVDLYHPYFQQMAVGTSGNVPTQMTQAQYEQYLQYAATYASKQDISNPYAQIVSNLNKGKTDESKGELSDTTTLQGTNSAEITKAPILYNKKGDISTEAAENKGSVTYQPVVPHQVAAPIAPYPQPVVPPAAVQQPIIQPSLFSLAQYSGSESDENNDEENNAQAVVIPPQETQIIIDKMASYVAKNGVDFENIVKAKGDPRFVFLETVHLYNPYYKSKLKECQGVKNNLINTTEDKNKSSIANKKEEISEKLDNNIDNKEECNSAKSDNKIDKSEEKIEKKIVRQKEKKIITPVCFSIKKHYLECQSVPRDKSALPIEDSTDEDEDQSKDNNEMALPGSTNQQTATSSTNEEILNINNNSNTENKEQNIIENKDEQDLDKITNIIEIEDPIMELIDLTEDLEEKRDRRAEDRVKDKLALAAREKLAAKNRSLQLERKKRAAAFLSQLKPPSISSNSKSEIIEETKNIRATTPEEGEINDMCQSIQDLSRIIYHIEPDKFPNNESDKSHNRKRSRSNSRQTHKSSHHRHKSHKRSHSHSRKRKHEKRSNERKKSKRRHRSRSKSTSKHQKVDMKDSLNDTENKKNRKDKISDHISFSSSEYESDEYPPK